jgi:hypothetical protein
MSLATARAGRRLANQLQGPSWRPSGRLPHGRRARAAGWGRVQSGPVGLVDDHAARSLVAVTAPGARFRAPGHQGSLAQRAVRTSTMSRTRSSVVSPGAATIDVAACGSRRYLKRRRTPTTNLVHATTRGPASWMHATGSSESGRAPRRPGGRPPVRRCGRPASTGRRRNRDRPGAARPGRCGTPVVLSGSAWCQPRWRLPSCWSTVCGTGGCQPRSVCGPDIPTGERPVDQGGVDRPVDVVPPVAQDRDPTETGRAMTTTEGALSRLGTTM